MLGKMYPSWVERTVNNTDDYVGATYTALLLKASYTFSTAHVFVSDLVPASNELSGGSYVRIALTGLAISRTGSVTAITFSPILFPLITATGTGAPMSMVIAKVVGSDATSPLILQQDFQTATDVTASDLTITPSPSGFVRYTSTP